MKQGLLSEAEIDVALKRMLRPRFELGLFDPLERVKAAQVPDAELDSPAHRELALKLARESMVLLKNDGVLPFAKAPARIAVVGPLADNSRVLLGNYNGWPSRSTTALAGIQKQFPKATVVFEPGTTYLRPDVPVPTSVLTTDDGRRRPEGRGVREAGLQRHAGRDADRRRRSLVGRDPRRRAAAGLRRAAAAAGAADALDRLPHARRERHLPPRRRGLRQPAVPRRQAAGRLRPAASRRPRASSTCTLEKGRRYAIRIESVPRRFASTRLVWMPPQPDVESRAVAAARDADVVVAVVGITSDLEGEENGVQQEGFKGGDRTSLDLPREEQRLLEAVKATGKPLVVVVMSGSAIAVNWAKPQRERDPAGVVPGRGGRHGDRADARRHQQPVGPAAGHRLQGRRPAARVHRLLDGAAAPTATSTAQPLFPFGHGLSYSTFAYSDLKVPATIDGRRAAAGRGAGREHERARGRRGRAGLPDVPEAAGRAAARAARLRARPPEGRREADGALHADDRDLSHVSVDGDAHRAQRAATASASAAGSRTRARRSSRATFEIKGERDAAAVKAPEARRSTTRRPVAPPIPRVGPSRPNPAPRQRQDDHRLGPCSSCCGSSSGPYLNNVDEAEALVDERLVGAGTGRSRARRAG